MAIFENVPCPFCGLACDDLEIESTEGRLKLTRNGCDRSRREFELPAVTSAQCLVAGNKASLAEAVAEAAALLRTANLPLFCGLATDVIGMRATLALAERTGGIVDHMNSEALLSNVLAMQDSGLIATTLAEVRSRADVLLFAGTDTTAFPRFTERVVWNRESPFRRGAPYVVFLGASPPVPWPADLPEPLGIECEQAGIGEVAAALRRLIVKAPLQTTKVAGVSVKTLAALAERLRAASYGVIVWSARDLPQPHGDLTVHSLCALVADLNQFTRFAALPLAGTDGDLTANQVTLWQTGFPLRTGFAAGVPNYDPYHHSARRLLDRGEADCLVWISSYAANRTAPATTASRIVLARPGAAPPADADVYIPVATPGLDHAGYCFRTDGIAALRLKQLRQSPLPSVQRVLAAVMAAL